MTSNKKLLVICLFLLAVLERTVFDLGPNTELVTACMVLGSFYLGQKPTLWLIFLVMLLTDRILGNTLIFIFTWSGFLLPALFIGRIFQKEKTQGRKKIMFGTVLGLSSNLFFYVWTNFGVWLLDSWGMYPKTANGLLSSYLNGLPFLRPQLLSSLIFIPLGFVVIDFARRHLQNIHIIKKIKTEETAVLIASR